MLNQRACLVSMHLSSTFHSYYAKTSAVSISSSMSSSKEEVSVYFDILLFG